MGKHSRSHAAGIAAIDREHASRNRGGSSNKMSQPAGGSTAIHDPGPKGKTPSMTGDGGIKAIKKLSGGRPDTAKGKNVS